MSLFTVFVVGPAGSGKSTFVAAFADWLMGNEIPYVTVNLDPAAEYVPYVPDVDVREYVTARQVMEEYALGPNGAIIASVDLLMNYLANLRDEIEESAAEGYVLVDTPGQMEVFAFRRSGVEVVRELSGERSGVTFIVDACISKSASSFASQIFLASSVYYRFRMPQLNVLNKTDLLSMEELENMVNWVNNPQALVTELERELRGEERLMMIGMLKAIQGFMESFSTYFISSKLVKGFDDVYAELQRIFRGGEDFEVPEYLRGDFL
ncbi:MAG TPA: GTPase [Thermofilaceae archaeon]|nr:GTPase [Thermofilaceae archaeon]